MISPHHLPPSRSESASTLSSTSSSTSSSIGNDPHHEVIEIEMKEFSPQPVVSRSVAFLVETDSLSTNAPADPPSDDLDSSDSDVGAQPSPRRSAAADDVVVAVDATMSLAPISLPDHVNRLMFLTHDVEARVMMHIYASWVLPYLDRFLKWPITMLTLLTGTSMWSSSALTPGWFLALATVQGVILLLMAMQLYFNFGSRAQRHGQLAEQYAILHRRLHHQFFKYQRRVHGLGPWGDSEQSASSSSSGAAAPSVAEIDRKWVQFFKSVDNEFRDIMELRPPEYIVEQVREWSLFQGWIRTGLFLYFRSSMCPVIYSLNEVMTLLTLTRRQLVDFLHWQRTQFHLTTQLQTMPLLDQDLLCMTKGLLLYHIVIELNLPFALAQRWMASASAASPPMDSSVSCCAASSCGLFICCLNEESLHAQFEVPASESRF